VIDTQTMVRELCDAHTHREHVEREHINGNGSVTLYGEDWTTEQPSLLDQLADAVHHVRNGEDAGGSGPQSKPTAQIDALDTLNRISAQAYEWAQRSTLAATVQAAYALTPSMLVIHLKAEAECAEAGCDHRASHTIRVCDTTYRDLTRSNSREIVPPVGDVSPREAGLLSGLVP
jgi:hypothetical protein